MSQVGTRIERDSLGEIEVPADAYWGAQTARALENYPISGLRPHPALVRATVRIKLAAARANAKAGVLDPRIASAIEAACEEILGGRREPKASKRRGALSREARAEGSASRSAGAIPSLALSDQFVVDPYQAGAGTSHHMNVNEVIASLASEHLGGARTPSGGLVHPNDHVNRSQSTNDVFPTALRLAACEQALPLLSAMEGLEEAFDEKAREFHSIVKSGRTHLQDASPIRLGREIGAWATNFRRHREAIRSAVAECGELGIGGTATGTGLTAPPGYREAVVEDLAAQTGLSLRPAEDLYEAMQSLRPAAALSSAIRNLAVDLFRISGDVRLYASGPTTGLGELILPAVQPGSSIMPGKVNPSIAEMVGQVCTRVIGCDTTVTWANGSGQLDLNVFFPVAAHVILEAETILANAIRVFDERCIRGMLADRERCAAYAARSQQLVLALAPRFGYERAAAVAKRAMETGRTIEEEVVDQGLLPADEARRILDPALLAGD